MACRLLVLSLAVAACDEGFESRRWDIIDGEYSPGHPGVVLITNVPAVRSCTAVAISPRVVLTAKHCTIDTTATDWIVAVGDVTRPPSERIGQLAVADMRQAGDPAVLVQGSGEDIAVLLLAEDFRWKTYGWADGLPEGFGNGSQVTLRAYGDTDPTEEIVFGVRYERSAEVYDLQDGTFAADVGGCHGDSGGPAIDEAGTVVGVASVADLPSCGGWTQFERVDVQAEMIRAAIADTSGADGDADADTDTDGDSDSDSDAGSDDAGSDAGADERTGGSSSGCGCTIVGR
ncbi:MAG: trypsin-like serine protease [Deltaproteobacteria bacterium]|nr:trypsin-like serine protease [Deltaproteobacteria bacterium]